MSYDITFCLSECCPQKELCARNFNTLISKGIKFERPVSMALFHINDKPCDYFIPFKQLI